MVVIVVYQVEGVVFSEQKILAVKPSDVFLIRDSL